MQTMGASPHPPSQPLSKKKGEKQKSIILMREL